MQQKQQGNDRTVPRSTLAIVVAFLPVFSLTRGAYAVEDQAGTVSSGIAQVSSVTNSEASSYQALVRWLEQHRNAEPAFQPGQHLTAKD